MSKQINNLITYDYMSLRFNKPLVKCLELLPEELENKILFFNHNIRLFKSLKIIKDVYTDINKYLILSNEDHNDTISIEFFQDYFLDEIDEGYWVHLALKCHVEKYKRLIY